MCCSSQLTDWACCSHSRHIVNSLAARNTRKAGEAVWPLDWPCHAGRRHGSGRAGSEVFVESVQQAAVAFGMTPAFVGFVVVALVGGAAEMASAFSGARKNRLDLTWAFALGSAAQIALFVAPVLVLLSYVIGPAPMNLPILAGRSGHDAHRHHDRVAGDHSGARRGLSECSYCWCT